MSVLHLYAIVRDGPEEDVGPGLAGERVRLVRVGGFRAAVGSLEGPASLDASALRGHDTTVRRIAARASAVLPMRFGQSVPDEPALVRLLGRAQPRLLDLLETVEDAEQMTLRVASAPPSRPRPARAPAAGGPGTRYLRERLAARERVSAPPVELAPVLAEVAPLVRAQRVRRSDLDRSVRVHHLVRRGDAQAYLERAARACGEAASLAVALSGPAPPYAFAAGVGP